MNVQQGQRTALDEKISLFIADMERKGKSLFIEISFNDSGRISRLRRADKSPFIEISFPNFLKQPLLLSEAVDAGIPFDLFQEIRRTLPFSDREWADFLKISVEQLADYKHSEHVFDASDSEKILHIAEVAEKGIAVFGGWKKFHLWLQTNIPALGGRRPKDLLHNSFGKELLLTELVHIEHGIFA